MLSLKDFKEVNLQVEKIEEIQGGLWKTIDCFDDNGCTYIVQQRYILGIFKTDDYRYSSIDD